MNLKKRCVVFYVNFVCFFPDIVMVGGLIGPGVAMINLRSIPRSYSSGKPKMGKTYRPSNSRKWSRRDFRGKASTPSTDRERQKFKFVRAVKK